MNSVFLQIHHTWLIFDKCYSSYSFMSTWAERFFPKKCAKILVEKGSQKISADRDKNRLIQDQKKGNHENHKILP